MSVNRRVLLAGFGAAIALQAVPKPGWAASEPSVWRGQALGAPAKIILYHPDRKAAERLLRESALEAERLENIFSLYRSESELSRLNRAGALAMPSPEMVELLKICHGCWFSSDGLFDPTVQPLWDNLRKHFSQANPNPEGPATDEWKEALSKVGFDKVRFNEARVAFEKPGMALTLNGIAQGYISDRIVALLRAAGVEHALVDMGEFRAIGTQPDGTPWRIGIADLEAGVSAEEFISIADQGLATSSFAGFQFDDKGRFNHLLNPKTGYSANLYDRLTVVAPDAASADAYATAFSLMKESEINSILEKFPKISVTLRNRDGEIHRLRV